mgnify:CR=1 FL=1
MMCRKNPVGLCGFSFVEFVDQDCEFIDKVLNAFGFFWTAQHNVKAIRLYQQGEINVIVNMEMGGNAGAFYRKHGPGVSAIGFRVEAPESARLRATSLDVEFVRQNSETSELNLSSIKGIGDGLIYFVPSEGEPLEEEFIFFDPIEEGERGAGLCSIDHLTHNVFRGRVDHWAKFYEEMFGFYEARYFDIIGEYTGLFSRAMVAPDQKIRIPLNEEADEGGGQIEEFKGIQW